MEPHVVGLGEGVVDSTLDFLPATRNAWVAQIDPKPAVPRTCPGQWRVGR
jgi:hypothetical protein